MSQIVIADLTPIHRGGLVATFIATMPSGLRLRCQLVRSKADPATLLPFPAGIKNASGAWESTVDFASAEVRSAWQIQIMAALEPFKEKLRAPQQAQGGRYEF